MNPDERIERALEKYRETQRRLHAAERIPDERQERTVQTLKVAVLYALVYVVAVIILTVFLLGCGGARVTGPTTDLEEVFFEIAQCYATHLELGPITFATFENEKPYCPKQGPCGYVACDAWPGGRHVECWSEWVNDPANVAPHFHNYAAHEVCHLSGIWDETEAEACAFAMVSKGVCS